jgi:hypothetical protein
MREARLGGFGCMECTYVCMSFAGSLRLTCESGGALAGGEAGRAPVADEAGDAPATDEAGGAPADDEEGAGGVLDVGGEATLGSFHWIEDHSGMKFP